MTEPEPTKDDMMYPSFKEQLSDRKIDADFLIKRLKREFNARETRVVKVKGAVRQEDLPKGFKVIATSGVLSYDKEGGKVYGDGDTLIRYDPQNMTIQQRARMDVHTLRRDYPTEKLEHSGTIVFESNVPEPDPLPKEEKIGIDKPEETRSEKDVLSLISDE